MTRFFTPAKPVDFSRWDSELELKLLRDRCRQRFWSFFQFGFGCYANPKGKRWIEDSVHEPLADWFQFHVEQWQNHRRDVTLGLAEPRQTHLAIIVHREVGKTTLISQAGQAWLHLLDPEISTYTGSEKHELAGKILGPIKACLDGSDPYSLWTKLYGNWAGQARLWKVSEVTHSGRKNTARKDPSLGTFGVETSIVGAHPDAIFYDDPISYERLKTDTDWLDRVNDQVSSLIPVLQSDGLLVWVGTRYASNDHFGVALDSPENGGDGIKSVAGMTTDSLRPHKNGMWNVFFMAGRDDQGKPTTPRVWPEQRLKDYHRRSPIRYAAQVMNDPSISDYNPITRDQIKQKIVQHKDIPWGSLRYAILTDLALWDGQQRINKDETVYEVWGYPRNGSGDVYYIEGDGSMYWRSEDFADRLIALTQRYRGQGKRIMGMTCDKPVAGMADLWKKSLTNRFHDKGEPMPILYQLVRGGTRKIERIAAAMDYWVDGHVMFLEKAPGLDRLIDQACRVGEMMLAASAGKKSRRKDDWIDTAADAFCPELYQIMRRQGPRQPYETGSIPISVDGLDETQWDDPNSWNNANPRPPLRG